MLSRLSTPNFAKIPDPTHAPGVSRMRSIYRTPKAYIEDPKGIYIDRTIPHRYPMVIIGQIAVFIDAFFLTATWLPAGGGVPPLSASHVRCRLSATMTLARYRYGSIN